MTGESTPRHRRWFRFSLRTFLLLFTLVSIAMGLYVKRVRDRRIAIETIKYWGGTVTFVPPPAVSNAQALARSMDRLHATVGAHQAGQPRPEFEEEWPQGSVWMQRMFGQYGTYHGSNVYQVILGKNGFTPEDVAINVDVLAPFNELQRLTLFDPITEDALLRLPKLPILEHLQLGIVHDENGDRGLGCLSKLPNLRRLTIGFGRFTAEGLSHIGSKKKLTRLRLHGCELSDDSLAHLASLPALTDLSFDGCTITDGAVRHLARLERLAKLGLIDTNMSHAGVEQLRELLPKCQIQAKFDKPGELRNRILHERQLRSQASAIVN